MDNLPAPPAPQRRFVQTPRMIAVRLGFFALLLILALLGLVRGSALVRAVAAAFLALAAAASAFAIYVMRRSSRPPHPLPEDDRHTGTAPEQSFAAAAPAAAGMRLFALQTGSTLVSFGQFFGGYDGWVGARAVWNMGADEATVFWAPVHAYLIDHPRHGPILVDTGLSRAQTEKGYYSVRKGGFPGLVWKESDNYLPPEQELLTQLQQRNIGPGDIRHVIMTHLDEDHVGELNRFAHATIYLSEAEWGDRHRLSYTPSYEAVAGWCLFQFDSGRFHAFAASKDLFGDGSIILVPTYGHSFGHTSLFVQMGDYSLCLAADALYTLRHLDAAGLGAFNYFGRQGFETQTDSARRLAAMQQCLPGLVYIPTHDPFAYTYELVHPFLADGVLTRDERQALRDYQERLFDDSGRLVAAARPQFERIDPTFGRVGAGIR